MISIETLEELARKNQTGVFPNIVREYFQHEYLCELYKLPGAEKLMFKGGTALRIVYGSPRFSEDLDFSLWGVGQHQLRAFVEELFVKVLAEIERAGIRVELGDKSNATTGGYIGIASFSMHEYPPVNVELNISSRKGKELRGEIDSIVGDFAPAYNIMHLPQIELVDEKIFGALRERKKPRDFYDLYFMMRKGMLSLEQKKRLAGIKDEIVENANNIDFRGELGAFLPVDQQSIIRDFTRMLEAEINRQVV